VPGYYHTVQQVTFRANEQADIYFTVSTTGAPADPTTGSTKYDGKPITVTRDTTFKVLAVDLAKNNSAIVTAAYHVNTANVAVGPMDAATGFPTWYSDNSGTQLKLCVTSECLTFVADPSQSPSVPGNFIDEAFYWNATATMPAGNGGKATLTLATEAAFASGNVQAGQQIAFNRIRIVVDGLVAGKTYVITHPYGKETLTAGTDGSIFFTQDIGCLDPGTDCLATKILGGRLGPWLTPVNKTQDAGYISDPAVDQVVTGSPYGTNYFLIEGPDAGGAGIDRAETNLFSVAGKLANP
jgi:hypothetical protein